jgi:hypothetical protein
MIGTVIGYFLLEIASLILSIVVGFFTWGLISAHPGKAGPGEGLGFILILMVSFPVWLIFAFFIPQEVHSRLQGQSKRLLRITISFFTPVFVVFIISLVMSLLFLI